MAFFRNMNIPALLRVLLLAAGFVVPIVDPQPSSGTSLEDFGGILFAGLVMMGFAFVAVFGGSLRILLSGRMDYLRPSMRAPIFSRRSPLQLFWDGGLLMISAGIGVMAGAFQTLSYEGVLMTAGGLGLYLGCLSTRRMHSRRFAGPPQ